MLTMLLGLFAAFCWSANLRFQLLKVGQDVDRTDQLVERLKGTYLYAFVQKKMDHYKAAGTAHKVIFIGFIVLLLNTLMLWGRGFDPEFNLWILGPEPVDLPVLGPVALGAYYEVIKDVVATLVLLGSLYFLYLRVYKGEERMTHSFEAVVILLIIITMMVGDFAYVGASHVLFAKHWTNVCAGGQEELCGSITTVASHLGAMPTQAVAELQWHAYPAPMGSLFSLIFENAGTEQLVIFAHVGFWFHATLVMIFLNLLPHSKHFHVITAIPNVFADGDGRCGLHRSRQRQAGRRRAHRGFHLEVDARFLYLHGVWSLLRQLPGAPHGKDAEPQAVHDRSAGPPLRARERVPES
jgi:hypothetical protein